DSTQEASLRSRGSALVLNLPGWRATSTTPDRLSITDGSSALLLVKDMPNIATPTLPRVFGPLLHGQGGRITFAPPRDERVDFTMTTSSGTKIGWMRMFRCAARNELVQAFAKSEADAQSLYDRVATARCRRAGEPAQVWPDVARR